MVSSIGGSLVPQDPRAGSPILVRPQRLQTVFALRPDAVRSRSVAVETGAPLIAPALAATVEAEAECFADGPLNLPPQGFLRGAPRRSHQFEDLGEEASLLPEPVFALDQFDGVRSAGHGAATRSRPWGNTWKPGATRPAVPLGPSRPFRRPAASAFASPARLGRSTRPPISPGTSGSAPSRTPSGCGRPSAARRRPGR